MGTATPFGATAFFTSLDAHEPIRFFVRRTSLSPPKEKTMINEYLRTIRTSNRNRILMATALERCGDLLFVATTQLSKANKTSFDPNVAYLCAL
jgi:hypothetical protein